MNCEPKFRQDFDTYQRKQNYEIAKNFVVFKFVLFVWNMDMNNLE